MNLKLKSLATLSAAATFALMATACGDSSSSGANSDDPAVLPADTTSGTGNTTPVDTLPAGEPPVDTTTIPVVPGDTTVVPSDTTEEFVLTIPEEATEITPAINIPAETGIGLLVDDFEDGDGVALINEAGWYTYSDKDNKGNSTILTPVDDNGYPKARRSDNGTDYAFAVYYNLDKGGYEYDPYVGWGVYIASDDMDFTKYGGVTYWFKGDAHEIHVEISDVEDYDVHLATVKASRVWKKVEVRFKDLTQGGWGEKVEFNAAHIEKISFQAKGKARMDSVLIDNLYLQDTSEVAKDVADMTIKDPEFPENVIGDITISNPLQAKAMQLLDKGINITNWLEDANYTFNGKFKFDESDIKLMAENGIKALRLPIDLDAYATNRDDVVAGKAAALEFDDKNLFAVLDSFATWTEKAGMSFVIDYHEYDNGYNKETAADPQYVTMMANVWKHVAQHYASNSRESIFFELLNEPDMSNGAVTSASWRKAAQEIIDSIRTVDKNHMLVFGDAEWYSISNLAKGEPLNDDKIIYAVHTYDPFEFTHQGASWSDTKTIKNLMFPYDKEKWSEYSADFGVTKSTVSYIKSNIKNYYKRGSKEFIMSVVLPAKNWAVKNNVPVIINEFGALNTGADAQSVLNYMTALREISEELEIPLQHWGYTGQFALFESAAGSQQGTKLIDGMKEAYFGK